MAEQDKSKEAEPGEIITGERHLGPAEGKEEASVFENEDERIRGPLLPSDKSSEEEDPDFDRDPRPAHTAHPEPKDGEISNQSRHAEEA